MSPNINTLRPRQNGRHFADDIFKCIFLNENVWMPVKISLKYVPKGPINNIPALVQIMAWRRSGEKPLFKPMMVGLPTHICVTQPQWKKNVDDMLTHWPLWDLGSILKTQFSILFYWLASSGPHMNAKRSLLMVSQHWFRQCLGAVRQQAISNLCHPMASCLLVEMWVSTVGSYFARAGGKSPGASLRH